MKPLVTHDCAYPSDEEIVPNPTSTFSKTVLAHFGQIHSWFKAGEGPVKEDNESTEEARAATPCLLITSGNGSFSDGDIHAQTYENVVAKLP